MKKFSFLFLIFGALLMVSSCALFQRAAPDTTEPVYYYMAFIFDDSYAAPNALPDITFSCYEEENGEEVEKRYPLTISPELDKELRSKADKEPATASIPVPIPGWGNMNIAVVKHNPGAAVYYYFFSEDSEDGAMLYIGINAMPNGFYINAELEKDMRQRADAGPAHEQVAGRERIYIIKLPYHSEPAVIEW